MVGTVSSVTRSEQASTSRGARVNGLDATEALLAIARESVPSGDFRAGDVAALLTTAARHQASPRCVFGCSATGVPAEGTRSSKE
jgi:hypothetical protein